MKSLAATVLLGCAVAGPVLAQPGAFGPREDSDGDGLITRAEAEAALDARFARLDTDGDGAISRDEVRAARNARRQELGQRMGERARDRLAEVDTDGDGALSLAELQAARPELSQQRFDQMDTNGDGLITADERPGRGYRGGRPGRGFGPQ